MDQTREHLRLLSLFHYVLGGIGCLVSLVPLIHLTVGIVFLTMPEKIVGPPPPQVPWHQQPELGPSEGAPAPPPPSPVEVLPTRLFGWLFTIIPAGIIGSGLLLSGLILRAGRQLGRLRSHSFCLVMAGVECALMPLGTILGVLTILVLMKPEARELFGLPRLPQSPAPTQ